MKRLAVMIAGFLLATGLWAAQGTAAPFQSQAPAVTAESQNVDLAQYGCRRDCHYSQRYGGWVRGAGPYCEIVQCTPHYAPRRACVKDWHCEKTGPLGLGKRCYWRELCH